VLVELDPELELAVEEAGTADVEAYLTEVSSGWRMARGGRVGNDMVM
jgi:hypothetical protein